MQGRVSHFLLLGIGFTLSPLSWWNDFLVNVPLAYLFAIPFSMLSEKFFLPSFILGYWLSNLLGLLLLHWGGEGILYGKRTTKGIKHSLIVSLLYSILMVIFVLLGWLESPTSYLSRLNL